MASSLMSGSAKRRATVIPYLDPVGDTAAHRIDREREQIEMDVVAGMAFSSLLSRRSSDEQCAEMIRGLSRWWDRGEGLSRRAWHITDHAATRAVEMSLDAATVQALLESPEETQVQGERSAYDGDVLYFRGDHAAAVARDSMPRRVITFLYRYQDDYEAQYANPAHGREARPWSHLPRKTA